MPSPTRGEGTFMIAAAILSLSLPRPHPRHVPHLAARAGLALAVNVHRRVRLREIVARAQDLVADQIAHLDFCRQPLRLSERQACHRADVLLELRDGGAVD